MLPATRASARCSSSPTAPTPRRRRWPTSPPRSRRTTCCSTSSPSRTRTPRLGALAKAAGGSVLSATPEALEAAFSNEADVAQPPGPGHRRRAEGRLEHRGQPQHRPAHRDHAAQRHGVHHGAREEGGRRRGGHRRRRRLRDLVPAGLGPLRRRHRRRARPRAAAPGARAGEAEAARRGRTPRGLPRLGHRHRGARPADRDARAGQAGRDPDALAQPRPGGEDRPPAGGRRQRAAPAGVAAGARRSRGRASRCSACCSPAATSSSALVALALGHLRALVLPRLQARPPPQGLQRRAAGRAPADGGRAGGRPVAAPGRRHHRQGGHRAGRRRSSGAPWSRPGSASTSRTRSTASPSGSRARTWAGW